MALLNLIPFEICLTRSLSLRWKMKKKEIKKTSVQLVVVTLGGRVIEHAENFDLMELLFACTEPILFSKKKNKI